VQSWDTGASTELLEACMRKDCIASISLKSFYYFLMYGELFWKVLQK